MRILESASGRRASAVEHALRQAGHDLRAALVMLERAWSVTRAQLLAASKGDVRESIAAGGDLRRAIAAGR